MDSEIEKLREEIVAIRAVMEHVLSPVIASHPQRDQLLEHFGQYRRQVVGSRDPVKASVSELLHRLDQAVRLQGETWT